MAGKVSPPRLVRDRALIPISSHSDLKTRARDPGPPRESGLLPLKPLPEPPPKRGMFLNVKA